MSDESLEIPIGADLSQLQTAFQSINASVMRMGNRINSSLTQANSAFGKTGKEANTISASFTKVWQSIKSGAAAAWKSLKAGAAAAARSIGGIFRSAASMITSVLGKIGKSFFIGGILGSLATLVASFFSARAAIRGFKAALDLGGSLSDMSARTGAAVKDLAVLQTAFKQNGINVEVGTAINRLQKALVGANEDGDATAEVFAKLGLDMDALRKLSPAAQFDAVGKAIAKLPDPASRAAAAMRIFGKAGGEMVTLFKDGNAIDNAAQNLGLQALLLQKNATLFDRLSDILNSAGNKLRGFFIGVADQIAPLIAPLMEAFDRLDFTGFGQTLGAVIKQMLPAADSLAATFERIKKIGQSIGVAFQTGLAALQTGNIGKFLSASIHLAMVKGVNTLASGISGAIAFLGAAMSGIMSGLGKGLKESGIELFLTSIFMGIANLLSSKLREAAADMALTFGRIRHANILRDYSKADADRSQTYFNVSKAALSGLDLSAGIDAGSADVAEAIKKGQAAFASATATPFIDPSIAESRMDEVRQTLADQVAKNQAAMDLQNAEGAAAGAPEDTSSAAAPFAAIAAAIRPAVTSLGRVGGGGGSPAFSPMISEQKRSNNLLTDIKKYVSIKPAGVPVIA